MTVDIVKVAYVATRIIKWGFFATLIIVALLVVGLFNVDYEQIRSIGK